MVEKSINLESIGMVGERENAWQEAVDFAKKIINKFSRDTKQLLIEARENGIEPNEFGGLSMDLSRLEERAWQESSAFFRQETPINVKNEIDKKQGPTEWGKLQTFYDDFNNDPENKNKGKFDTFFGRNKHRLKNFVHGLALTLSIHVGAYNVAQEESFVESFDHEQFAEDLRKFIQENPDFFSAPGFAWDHLYLDIEVADGAVSPEQGQTSRRVFDRLVSLLEPEKNNTMSLFYSIGSIIGRYHPQSKELAGQLIDLRNLDNLDSETEIIGNCEARAKLVHSLISALRPDLDVDFMLYKNHVQAVVSVGDVSYVINPDGPRLIINEPPGYILLEPSEVILFNTKYIGDNEQTGVVNFQENPQIEVEHPIPPLVRAISIFAGFSRDKLLDYPVGGGIIREQSVVDYEVRREEWNSQEDFIPIENLSNIVSRQSQTNVSPAPQSFNPESLLSDQVTNLESETVSNTGQSSENNSSQILYVYINQPNGYILTGGTAEMYLDRGYSLERINSSRYVAVRETSEERVERIVEGINFSNGDGASFAFFTEPMLDREYIEVLQQVTLDRELIDPTHMYIPDTFRDTNSLADYIREMVYTKGLTEVGTIQLFFRSSRSNIDFQPLIDLQREDINIEFEFHGLEVGFDPPRGVYFTVEIDRNGRPVTAIVSPSGYWLNSESRLYGSDDFHFQSFCMPLYKIENDGSMTIRIRTQLLEGNIPLLESFQIIDERKIDYNIINNQGINYNYRAQDVSSRDSGLVENVNYLYFIQDRLVLDSQTLLAQRLPEYKIELYGHMHTLHMFIQYPEYRDFLNRVGSIRLNDPHLGSLQDINEFFINNREFLPEKIIFSDPNVLLRYQHEGFGLQYYNDFVNSMRQRGVEFPNLDENNNFHETLIRAIPQNN